MIYLYFSWYYKSQAVVIFELISNRVKSRDGRIFYHHNIYNYTSLCSITTKSMAFILSMLKILQD